MSAMTGVLRDKPLADYHVPLSMLGSHAQVGKAGKEKVKYGARKSQMPSSATLSAPRVTQASFHGAASRHRFRIYDSMDAGTF
jgi:hypothetical protein